MFYDNLKTLENDGEMTWMQSRSITINNPTFPDAPNGKSRESYISTTPPDITVFDNRFITPYAHPFNVDLAHMLTRDISLTLDGTYVNRYVWACNLLPNVLASERERGDMRVLTDDPAIVAEFFPGAQADTWDDRDLPSPDRELVDALGLSRVRSGEAGSSNGFWSRIILISDTERSQFDAVEHLLGAGYTLPGPVASMALSGRRFHGQRRREWVGARGNVHLTVAMPTRVSTEHVGAGLSMLPAVAAVDAIAQASDGAVHPAIKWVNDIEIAGRKVGGVLTAAHITGRQIDDVIWGIGINVAIAPEIHPTVFVPATTCVHAEPKGERVTVPRLFWALIRAIEHRYTELIEQGPSGLFAAYRASSLVVGRSVSVWNEADCADNDPARWGPPLAEGIVADIARDLSLGLEGRRDRVSKGRLAVRALRPRSVGGIR